jgi:hypothetical protein
VNVLAPASTPPSVSSSAAGSVTVTTATLNGNVTNAGTSEVSARGFIYSTVETALEIGAPGVNTVAGGAGVGAFVAEVSGLSGGATYYFRAYAINETGTSYGEIRSFTTLKAEPQNYPETFASGTVTTSQIPVTWTRSEADGYLLMVSSSTITPPMDGVVLPRDSDVSDGSGAVNLGGDISTYNGFTGFTPGETYTFVIYPFNNSGSAIDYKTAGPPTFTTGLLTTPELSVSGSPAALTTTYGSPSSSTTFTVSGAYLTSTVSVTAPSGFEVSSDNASFDTSVILTPTAANLPSTTIYLRLAATAGVGGTYDARNITVSGGGAESVVVTTAANGHSVATKTLTIAGLSAADKVYDGTASASVAGAATYDGLVNNESFPMVGTVGWAFADKLVGAGKTLVRTGDFAAPSANYSVTQPGLTAGITTKDLIVTGARVTTKTYDGTTSATITSPALSGVVEGDTVTVSGGGNFNDANAGANKPVIASLLLGGVDAANYSLTQPSLTGSILKADQTITFAELPAKNVGDAPFTLAATASLGSPVSYSSSSPAVASVSGSTVTVLGPGTTVITATQEGTSNFNAAAPVSRELLVSESPTLLAGWDFQTTTTGGTAAANGAAPLVYRANFGFGAIHLDGANGSSSWVSSTNSLTNQVTGFGGTALNAASGFSTNTSSPSALALVAGPANAANGNSFVLTFSMSGRKNLGVSYATRGTTSGFTTHTWSVSTDASNWTEVSVQTGRNNTNFTTVTLPVITNVDNVASVYLRATVSGATTSTGNNRLDNIQLVSSAYVAPDTTAPIITVLGENPLSLAVGATFTDPGATALDAADGHVEVSATGSVNTTVPGSYTITYTATDAAANTATATRTVNVVDITAPVITVSGDNPLYLPVGATFNEPGVSASDAIDGSVTVSTTGSVNTAARGTYILTYSATDAAGNIATATRDVVVRSRAAHAFAVQYGLTGASAALTADADNDGVANILEYAFGSDPSSDDSAPSKSELILNGDNVRFIAIVRDGDTAMVVSPSISTDLRAAWSNTGVVEIQNVDQAGVPAGFRRRTWEASAGSSALFVRFGVSYE